MNQVPPMDETANAAASMDGNHSSMQLLTSAPARLVHPQRIVSCYEDALTLDVAVKLQACDRVQPQLALLVAEQFGLAQSSALLDLAPEDLALMRLAPAQLDELVVIAGAAYWAHVFAAEIRTSEVALMKQAIGEAAFKFALANRDLAGHLAHPGSTDNLIAAVRRDGLHCIGSWHASLPGGLAGWARLKHASDKEVQPFAEEAQRALGLAIMNRLAADLDLMASEETAQ